MIKIGTGKRLAGIVTTIIGLVALFLKVQYGVEVDLDPDEAVTAIGFFIGAWGTIHAVIRPKVELPPDVNAARNNQRP